MIEFKKYKKVARTQARLLTPQDYEERRGLVYAPEGILKFTPGDYLARDAKGEWTIRQATMRDRYVKVAPEGEWTIRQATMRDRYVKVAPEDEDGFAQYLRTDSSFAAQMPEPFTIDGMRGQAGDYLVVNERAGWPVAREIFEQTYEPIERDNG